MKLQFKTKKASGDLVSVVMQVVNYNDLLVQDLATLKSIDVEELKAECLIQFGATETDVNDALNGDGSIRGRKGLITSLEQSLSGANKDFHPKATLVKHETLNGVKVDTVTSEKFVSGLIVSETLIEKAETPIVKKEVKSGLVVQLKSFIEHRYKLVNCKFRTYKLSADELIDLAD